MTPLPRRAINNGLLDTYQLKSLDGLLEAGVEDMALERRAGRIYVQFPWEADSLRQIQAKKGRCFALSEPVTFCEGYRFTKVAFMKYSISYASVIAQ